MGTFAIASVGMMLCFNYKKVKGKDRPKDRGTTLRLSVADNGDIRVMSSAGTKLSGSPHGVGGIAQNRL